MSLENNRIKNLPEYTLNSVARKIHNMRSGGIDVIDCTQINPSMPPPQIALDIVVQEMLKPHNHKYSVSVGIERLRTAFADYYKDSFNTKVEPHEVVVTSGTKEAIGHLLFSTLQAGDTVLVPIPSYPIHTAAIALAGAGFVGVPIWENYSDQYENKSLLTSEYNFFFDQLESRYLDTWPRPKCILTAFPHNPSTTIVDKSFWNRLISFAEENNCFIINDFAHGDLVFSNNDRISLLSVKESHDRTVEVYSLSKGYNLGGWRVGCATGSKELLNSLTTLKGYLDFGTLLPLQLASSALLENEMQNQYLYRNSILEEYSSRKEIFLEVFEEVSWRVAPMRATPFMWVELQNEWASSNANIFSSRLLDECHLGVYDGSGFDPRLHNLVRISLIQSCERLRSVQSKLIKFLNNKGL